jgi:hypothetical protein
MKHEAARYISECDACRKVKADYLKHGGLLQPLGIIEWKWDDISMDFIVGLSMMACKLDLIWVIVDRLSKSAHFIPVNTNCKVQKYAEIYIAHVLLLAQSSKDDNLRSRFTVYHSFLGATAHVPQNSPDP